MATANVVGLEVEISVRRLDDRPQAVVRDRYKAILQTKGACQLGRDRAQWEAGIEGLSARQVQPDVEVAEPEPGIVAQRPGSLQCARRIAAHTPSRSSSDSPVRV